MKRRAWWVAVAASVLGARTSRASADAIPIAGVLRTGELLVARVSPRDRVRFEGAPLPITPSGRVLFAVAHDEPGPRALVIQGARGVRRQSLALAPRADPSTDVQLPAISADALAAHRRSLARFARARRVVRDEPLFEHGLEMPLDGGVTGSFGTHRPHGVHLGLDLAVPVGTSVRAPGDAVVSLTLETPVFGRTLILDHGHGLTSSLLHLSRVLVDEGQRVRRGELVAESGRSGRVTGAHLDWRIAWRDRDVSPLGALALLADAR